MSGKKNTCWGCQENQPGQLAHMGPGGCLANNNSNYNSNATVAVFGPSANNRVATFKRNAKGLTNRVKAGNRPANANAQYNRLGAEYEVVRNIVADANKEEIDRVFANLHAAIKGGRRRRATRRRGSRRSCRKRTAKN